MKNKDINNTTSALEEIFNKNDTKPYMISSDNDSSFLGKQFQNLLKKNNIFHNVNIAGDHNALGVVDRLARTLKTILTKVILRRDNKNWVTSLDKVVNRYNRTEHRGILNYTPYEVMHNRIIQGYITEYNAYKNQKNKTVIDLNKGDKVRKKIKNKFSKGTDPIWSDKIYLVDKMVGKRVLLTNGKEVKRINLLLIPSNTTDDNIKNNVNKSKDEAKQQQFLDKEDIKEENIINYSRTRLKRKKIDNYFY